MASIDLIRSHPRAQLDTLQVRPSLNLSLSSSLLASLSYSLGHIGGRS